MMLQCDPLVVLIIRSVDRPSLLSSEIASSRHRRTIIIVRLAVACHQSRRSIGVRVGVRLLLLLALTLHLCRLGLRSSGLIIVRRVRVEEV
eukprot:545178-Rhodomonas_salina.1